MDMYQVGGQIALLRKNKGMTQSELGERLGVSFQAVSKWERGETLPDTAVLPTLAAVLETTVDFILSGGEPVLNFRGRVSIADLMEGIRCLEKMGKLLGKENLIYRHAVSGINQGMNTDVEAAFLDDYAFEAFLAEAAVQSIMAGAYVDLTDIKRSFKYDHFREIVMKYCGRYGLK